MYNDFPKFGEHLVFGIRGPGNDAATITDTKGNVLPVYDFAFHSAVALGDRAPEHILSINGINGELILSSIGAYTDNFRIHRKTDPPGLQTGIQCYTMRNIPASTA